MRFEDWDILLFPRECKTPFKEFNVACHLVHDLEFSHTHGSAGLPTVCCFVPSLPAGQPFQVSIHSWNSAPVSQLARSHSSYAEQAKLQVRLFIDGRQVSSPVLDREGSWPNILACGLDPSRGHNYEALKFPSFRHEILRQDYWSPADDLGRIKIVISEGFPRDSVSNPFERVNNLVAFSFQHAPLKILEGAGIAWPSPALWQRSPFVPSSLVDHTAYTDATALTAAGSKPRVAEGSHMSGLVMAAEQAGCSTSDTGQATNRLPHLGGSSSSQNFTQFGVDKDSFEDATAYFEWLGNLNNEMGSSNLPSGTTPGGCRAQRDKPSTDTSMPDCFQPFTSLFAMDSGVIPSANHESSSFEGENPFGTAYVPTNTPTAGRSESFDSIGMPLSFPENNHMSSGLAMTLTSALLNHPSPVQQCRGKGGPSSELDNIKSRKENLRNSDKQAEKPQRIISPAIMPSDKMRLSETRKLSQAVSQISTTSAGGASLRDTSTTSTVHSGHLVLSQPGSPLFSTEQTQLQTSSRPGRKCLDCTPAAEKSLPSALSATSGNATLQRSKRSRDSTPVTGKGELGDEENTVRRVSPRLGPSQFTARGGGQSPDLFT